MTDHHDELASAWLDGELTPAEEAAAAADPTVVRSRAELSAVRDGLSAPVPVPAERREAHLARALGELGGGHEVGAGAAPAAGATVLPLRAHRPGMPTWLARAAAVAALAGAMGVGANALRGDTDDDDVATGPMAALEAADADTDAGHADDAAQDDEGMATLRAPDDGPAPEAAGDAGDPATVAEAAASILVDETVDATALRYRLEALFGPADGWAIEPGPAPLCAVRLDELERDAAPHIVVVVTLEDDAVALVVPAEGQAYFADPSTCEPADPPAG
jgi:hypothetical protein